MNKKGQALVEMAIMLPILFLFVFGITEFGRAMYIKNMLNNAAKSAARAAVVTTSLTNTSFSDFSATTCNSSTDPIKQKICQGLFYITDSDRKNFVTATVVTSPNPTAQSGDTVNVTVTYSSFKPFVKLIRINSSLIGSASMRYE
jgi:Flp pilus assembly protein TadG